VAQDSVTLTFTPNNFNVAQTLHVVAIDNAVVNDPVSARVSSTVKTTDAAYNALATPFKRFTITDDETSGGGGGSGGTTIKTFAASTAYTISFPYMPGSGADSVGLPAQIFDRAMKTGDTVNYHLYSFKANTQNGALLPIGSETEFKIPSNNYVELDATTPLTRGRGYILVTGKSAVGLLAKGNGLVALANSSPSGDPLFSVALRTNPNFTGGAVRNGLNLIGFPFDPKQYSSVTLENCSVTVVSNGTPVTKTWAEAVGAGWINGDVFSVDPTTGHLTRLASDAHQVNALSAVFVQTYVDGAVLTLKSPAPAS
jgi:hypothetical protein